MRTLLYLSIFMISCSSLVAQVTVDATPTGKHAEAINGAKARRAEVKKHKQQYKETRNRIKAQQKARRRYKKEYQLLMEHKHDSVKALKRRLPDSLHWSLTLPDSSEIANEILSSTDFPEEYKLLLTTSMIFKDSLEIQPQKVNQAVIQKGKNLAEQVTRAYLPSELSNNGTALDPYTSKAGGLTAPNLSSRSKPNPNQISPEDAMELFDKMDSKQFQSVQQEIQQLKKKYSEIPDTRYPKEGTKRNSLGALPFWKRIDITGNLSLQSTDPLIVDGRVQLGYWMSKKWLVGVGMTVREQLNKQDSVSVLSGDGVGYSFFTRYNLPKNFFAWGEMEHQVNRSFFGSDQQRESRWQQAHLIGIGREFRIGIVQMLSLVMYDFNYQNNALHARPLVFRMGIRFTRTPGRGKKN